MNYSVKLKEFNNKIAFLRKLGILLALAAVLFIGNFLSEHFLTTNNMINILEQVSIVGVIAIGQTYVILTEGIDLSIGSLMALSLILFAGLIGSVGLVAAALIGILISSLFGLFNGLGITYGELPPFIMTVGMLSVARGIVFIYSGGTPIPILDQKFMSISVQSFFGIPISIYIFIFFFIIFWWILTKTPFGRSIYAIGANEEAAHLSGVPVIKYKIMTYIISGFCAGIGSLLFAFQLGVGTPAAGGEINLDTIAATVVGGTALTGGKGKLENTMMGAFIIGAIANLLNLMGVNPFIQRLFKGAIVVIAVFIIQRSEK